MSRMALIALAVAFVAGTAGAELCDLAPGESVAPDRADLPGDWRNGYLDRFQDTLPQRAHQFWGSSRSWDVAPLWTRTAGADIDRWWYAYLDRGRYRFLDETQYTLLDGPAGLWWRWRYRAWLDAADLLGGPFKPPAEDDSRVIPEPQTAVFLALGAFLALRMRRCLPGRATPLAADARRGFALARHA